MAPEITPEAVLGIIIIGGAALYASWNFVQLVRWK